MDLGLNYSMVLELNYEFRTKVIKMLCRLNGVLSCSNYFLHCF